MKLDGFAVQYLLSREFDDVVGLGLPRGMTFDYPMLYDVSGDMRGHVVLVPAHERPAADMNMGGTLCVCVDADSAKSAREAGAAIVLIRGDVVFQHLYNRMQHVFVVNERLDAQLHALVDTYAGFQPLLDACTQAMGHPCALIDEQYRIVCKSPASEAVDANGEHGDSDVDALEPDSIDLFMASREYRYMRESRSVFTMPNSSTFMMKNIFARGQLVGSLVLEHEGDALNARFARFVLNYLSSFVEEAYSRIGSFGVLSVGAEHVKAALQDALAGNAAGYASLEAALVESGHRPGCDYALLKIERSFTNEGVEELDYLAHRLELIWPYAHCFMHGGELFMLVDETEGSHGGDRDFSKELPLVARENLLKVGVSRTFNEMRRLDAAIAQARIALKCGNEEDPTNWCYRFRDYAFTWILSNAVGGVPPDVVCHPAVATLARYDEGHGTDLLHTLSTFMKCRYNATLASNELFVARSTLLNRLARIEQMTKVDLDDPTDRTYLAVSLALIPDVR